MSPQFVDFDGDGHLDVLTATFDGSPHLALGAEDGYSEPEMLLDAAGERIALSHIWNYDDTEHQVSGRGMPGGEANGVRCISVLAYDWDRDGDHDLLLGSYEQGRLYRQMNEGSNAEPRFTGVNLAIEVGGQELSELGKMTAPRLVDWDGDGDDDLLYGTFKNGDEAGGGVYLARNRSASGAPVFAAPETLVPAVAKDADGPTRPDEGLYPDAVDFDGDGDLDLVVGGYSVWTPAGRELDAEERALAERLRSLRDDALENGKFEAYREYRSQLDELVPAQQRSSFVWLYERVEAEPAASSAAGSTD